MYGGHDIKVALLAHESIAESLVPLRMENNVILVYFYSDSFHKTIYKSQKRQQTYKKNHHQNHPKTLSHP